MVAPQYPAIFGCNDSMTGHLFDLTQEDNDIAIFERVVVLFGRLGKVFNYCEVWLDGFDFVHAP